MDKLELLLSSRLFIARDIVDFKIHDAWREAVEKKRIGKDKEGFDEYMKAFDYLRQLILSSAEISLILDSALVGKQRKTHKH